MYLISFFTTAFLIFIKYGIFPLTLTRGPYVQNIHPDSASIIWRMDEPTTTGVVLYGITSDYTDATTDTASALQHKVVLTGLDEGAIYHYKVKTAGEILTGDLTFHSAKGPGFDSFTFVAMGDHRSDPANHSAVANRVKEIDPEIIINSGDLVTDGNDINDWDPEFFVPEKDVMSRICFFPSIGNHEGNAANYLEYFDLPTMNSGTERYYSFDYANAHFIMLDTTMTYSSGSPQYNWLENDLIANRDKQWIFAAFHHPPYSACEGHGSNLNVRVAFCPLFEKYGVDMVFNGHDHDYERGLVNGIYYVVTGGGGAPLHTNGSDWWTIFSASEYHCCKISINGDTLGFEAIKSDGTVMDSFTMTVTRSEGWTVY